jgi:hypothetical protein
MRVTGLGWAGTRTAHAAELASFYEKVLRLPMIRRGEGFWVFELPDGRHVEVFSSTYAGKDHFDTGPVVGFGVEDLSVRGARTARCGNRAPGDTRAHLAALSGAGRERLRARRRLIIWEPGRITV